MKRALIFLALLAVSPIPMPGQVGLTALYTQYEHPPPSVVVIAMQNEVYAQLNGDGLRFSWRSLPMTVTEVWNDLAVLSFKGYCEPVARPPVAKPNQNLGWTHVIDGEVIPFADIDCNAIHAFVDRELSPLSSALREAVFGRAVGRVVAHELLHVFARAKSHSSEGVDRPTITVGELLAEKLSLADKERELQILRPQNPGKMTPVGSPLAGRQIFARDGCSSCHGMQAEGTRRGPVLRVTGRAITNMMLAAKLTKNQKTMMKAARSLKLAKPSISEAELPDLLSFLNHIEQ